MRNRAIYFIILLLVTGFASYAINLAANRNQFLPLQNLPVRLAQENQASNPPTTSGSDLAPAVTVNPDRPEVTPPIITGPIHALRVDYQDMANSRGKVIPLEQKIRQAGFNMVSLGAGRAEWTYFKWAGHEDAWSSEVKAAGIDFLLEDSARFGSWAQIDAAVDVLCPLYIQKNPKAAAISFDGVPSANLVSTMQLVEGPYGKSILDMITAIAANYPVNSISINEMYYQRDGYGPDDRAAYLKVTGRPDWPRTQDGRINTEDPSIGEWRSAELARFIEQAQNIAHRYGKQLLVNIALNLGNTSAPVLDFGGRLDLIQDKIDRILLWGFFNPEMVMPQELHKAAEILAKAQPQAKFIFVIGLWNKENQPINPSSLSDAINSLQAGGISNIWITPATMMTSQLWEVVSSAWSAK